MDCERSKVGQWMRISSTAVRGRQKWRPQLSAIHGDERRDSGMAYSYFGMSTRLFPLRRDRVAATTK
jgi:hypothetical protein